MSTLALEVDQAMKQLDAATASRLERLVRDALALVKPAAQTPAAQKAHQEWLQRLDTLRATVGTGRQGTTTEAILDELREERGS